MPAGLFGIVLEALSREMWSECPEELIYTDDLPLVSERVEELKGRVEGWEGAFKIVESRW